MEARTGVDLADGRKEAEVKEHKPAPGADKREKTDSPLGPGAPGGTQPC